jgi:hypothetical protein
MFADGYSSAQSSLPAGSSNFLTRTILYPPMISSPVRPRSSRMSPYAQLMWLRKLSLSPATESFLTSRLSYVYLAQHTDLQLSVGGFLPAPEAPSVTDLVLYASPVTAYTWKSRSSIGQYANQGIELARHVVSRVTGALMKSVLALGEYLDDSSLGLRLPLSRIDPVFALDQLSCLDMCSASLANISSPAWFDSYEYRTFCQVPDLHESSQYRARSARGIDECAGGKREPGRYIPRRIGDRGWETESVDAASADAPRIGIEGHT